MKRVFQRTFAAVALTVLSTFNVASEALAVQFGQKEVEQQRFVAMAVPRTYGYSLIIVEQISNSTPCWSESGSNPIEIDPLLLNFDFTGICGRATDSNGYSVRMGGEDLALSHSLSVRGVGNEILLVATSRENPYQEPIVIGRSNGMSNGFVKLVLQPGWRFTKRTYQDKTLGHIYFTHDYSESAYLQTVNPAKTENETSKPADSETSGRTENDADKPAENVGSNGVNRGNSNRNSNRVYRGNSNRVYRRNSGDNSNRANRRTDGVNSNVSSGRIFHRSSGETVGETSDKVQ